MRHIRRWSGWLFIVYLVTVVAVMAQDDCPVIVNDALNSIGNNCANLDRNTACYGNDRVDSTFFSPQPPGFFTRPADRTLLPVLQSIKTSGFDVNNGQFGVAVLNVQANVPEVIPGQGVLFLLMGDMQMINSVDPAAASSPIAPVPVTTQIATAVYSLPALTASIRASLPAGAVVNVDGSNTPGDWLRVVDTTGVNWIQRSTLVADSLPNPLPNVGENSRMPMQAFYFYTGSVGEPRCTEAESVIAIQTPENIQITLGVNGVDIRVGSMVTLTPNTLTVHRGHVSLTTGQEVNANETLDFLTDESGNIMGDGSVRPVSDEEFNRGGRTQNSFNVLAEANEWALHEITPRDAAPIPLSGDSLYTIVAGDTLFGIARRFNASMPDIIRVNGLNACRLVPGQQLSIPNAGGGFVVMNGNPCGTETVIVPPDAPPLPPVDSVCANFRHLSGGEAILSTFSWSPVPDADQYKVNFYDVNGSYRTSVFVTPPSTKVDVNLGDVGPGTGFQWEVEAFKSGQRLCNTGRSAMTTTPPDRTGVTPVPVQPFMARRVCKSANQATVFWEHAQEGANITIFGENSYAPFPDFNATIPNARSGMVDATVSTSFVLFQVYSDKGDFASLPGCP